MLVNERRMEHLMLQLAHQYVKPKQLLDTNYNYISPVAKHKAHFILSSF